jgi:hypothetical protein
MTLKGPDNEDIRKINAEVNQLVNQRLALVTLAITIFTAFLALLVPRDSSSVGNEFGLYRYSLLVLMILFEFVLFILSYHLTTMLRIFTAYLDVTGRSGWETDWKKYRNEYPGYWGYTKPQSIIFLVIGIVAGGLPILFFLIFQVPLGPWIGAAICGAELILYIILVTGMGFFGWFAREDKIKNRWLMIKEESEL